MSALSNAVYAYAAHIDDLGKLTDAIQVIVHKHVSLNIPPEGYKDVGTELLKSIKQILGDAATDDIMNAWTEGLYNNSNLHVFQF